MIVSSAYGAYFAYLAESPFLFQKYGFEPRQMGFFYIMLSLFYIAGNLTGRRLINYISVNWAIIIGLFLFLAGSISLVCEATIGMSNPLWIILSMSIITAGNGFIFPLGTASTVTLFPKSAGTASGLMGFLQLSTASISVGLLGYGTHHQELPLAIFIAFTALIGSLSFIYLFLKVVTKMSQMRNYKLVIFDFDGTVFATHEAIIHCINKTFEKYQNPIPSREIVYKTITMGVGLDETFKLLNPDLSHSEDGAISIQQWVDTYREFYRSEGEEKSHPFDKADSVLDSIYSLGKIIIVISNKGIEALNSALDKFDLKKYVSLVVGDTKGIKKKPDPMIFEQIIKPKFNEIDSSEILVVGDTTADLLFAKNIGADSCWAAYGYGLHRECENLSPTYSISNFSDLDNIFIEKPNNRLSM